VVTVEAALSLVLLVGAGLMVRTLWRLHQVDLGFRANRVLTMRMALPETSYPEHHQVARFAAELVARVEALPGAQAAGLVTRLPLGGLDANASFAIDGSALAAGEGGQNADYRIVTPRYFRALGIPLLRGRSFVELDDAAGAPVAIVNQTFAGRFCAGGECLGKRLTLGEPGAPWATIVGVVGDVRHHGVHLPPRPEMYFPRAQPYCTPLLGIWRAMTLVVRAEGDAAGLGRAARATVRAIDPALAVAAQATMEEVAAESMARPRTTMLLLLVFATTAVVLAGVGLYGVTSHLVAQHTREIGIRVALGAARGDVQRMVIGQGTKPALAGIVAGTVAALGLTRWLRSLLFEVSPADPLTFAVVALLIAALALLVCWLPARRAVKIEPLLAMRSSSDDLRAPGSTG
jgi:predicted permease